MLSYDDFSKLELKIATVRAAERVEGSEKLLKLAIDVGEEAARTLVAGIGKRTTPEELIGTQIVIIANLEPRMLMGIESQGMLLATDGDDGPVLLRPEHPVKPGSGVH
ncbi:methionine--tRNA ligase subunit beta [Candidatus Uhrbacteria bacterium]|nr:methionine--tRNA ligase subunit beta [Candidatus Uhrbacteria bacterium]